MISAAPRALTMLAAWGRFSLLMMARAARIAAGEGFLGWVMLHLLLLEPGGSDTRMPRHELPKAIPLGASRPAG